MFSLIRPSRIAAVAIIIGVSALLTNCRDAVYAAINAPSYIGFYERHADLRYGDLPRQTLDVYAPRGVAGRPMVVFWYGGAWHKGRKDQYRFVGAALAGAGYVAVLPDYRILPQARFPQFIDDGAMAVKWAHDHARELGGDPRKIVLMGHSAGAHLAATLALDARYLEKVGGKPDWIRGWIALSAPYELKRLPGWLYRMFQERATSEWRPISLVSNRAPPALLVHGLDDATVDPQEVIDMQTALRVAGVPVECRLYDVGHIGTVLAFSPTFRLEASTLADVRKFIDDTTGSGTLAANQSCPDVRGRRHGNWEHPPARPDLLEIE